MNQDSRKRMTRGRDAERATQRADRCEKGKAMLRSQLDQETARKIRSATGDWDAEPCPPDELPPRRGGTKGGEEEEEG
jgi:hypothetical protein